MNKKKRKNKFLEVRKVEKKMKKKNIFLNFGIFQNENKNKNLKKWRKFEMNFFLIGKQMINGKNFFVSRNWKKNFLKNQNFNFSEFFCEFTK